jgi:hypothetical protein
MENTHDQKQEQATPAEPFVETLLRGEASTAKMDQYELLFETERMWHATRLHDLLQNLQQMEKKL